MPYLARENRFVREPLVTIPDDGENVFRDIASAAKQSPEHLFIWSASLVRRMDDVCVYRLNRFVGPVDRLRNAQ